MKLPSSLQRLVVTRHGGTVLFIALFVGLSTLVRLALLMKSAGEVGWNPSLLASFFWGFIFDVAAAGLWSLPITLGLTLLPAKWFEWRWARVLTHLAGLGITANLLFTSVSEWTFWDEFSVRFNFIAVDYLVYTTEVIANIRESYNMPAIFGGIALGTVLIYGLLARTGLIALWMGAPLVSTKRRWLTGLGWFVVPLVFGLLIDSRQLPEFRNDYNRELAKNGPWSFVAAFRNNELDYKTFYPSMPLDDAFARLRPQLAADGAVMLGDNPHDTLRYVSNDGPPIKPNVIQITVESLSASFMGTYNPGSSITPHLDALVEKSLVFDHYYATGTRTVRGMEAMTLSLPPTPGRSIVKRPRNADMFSLGSVFRSQGYDTAFIYSGYGYFDNMNAFFGNNGYRIVDRTSVGKEDITFANAWGACDEDLFNWTLREADQGAARGKPFHYFVMTTSNHRPFTYPEGKIDLPSKISGRDGGVKYTDYAINKFLEDAAKKPWFKNTIFVIVSDHCASVAGKSELPVQNYHIPLLIYAPGGQIKAGRVNTLMSQIDYPPTLLGLLNWSYASRFYGWDVMKTKGRPQAFVGNYQKLGMFRDQQLTILKPVRQVSQFDFDPETFALTPLAEVEEAFRDDAVAYYQTAAAMYARDTYRKLTPNELERYQTAPTNP
jgi:arylsulfatase A-like enzyme|uniref:LTA synthase family protein n=1 Tax=Cephaloticoccus sp. TaxID=1985742 RepID=UPI004048EE4F